MKSILSVCSPEESPQSAKGLGRARPVECSSLSVAIFPPAPERSLSPYGASSPAAARYKRKIPRMECQEKERLTDEYFDL